MKEISQELLKATEELIQAKLYYDKLGIMQQPIDLRDRAIFKINYDRAYMELRNAEIKYRDLL